MSLSNPDFSSLIIPSRKCVIKPVFCPAAVLKDPARLILHIRRIFPGSQAPPSMKVFFPYQLIHMELHPVRSFHRFYLFPLLGIVTEQSKGILGKFPNPPIETIHFP